MENLNRLYKQRYHIAFYADNDEDYLIGFDNVTDICKYKKMVVDQKTVCLLRVELCKALKRKDHYTRMVDGRPMHVYLIDMISEE